VETGRDRLRAPSFLYQIEGYHAPFFPFFSPLPAMGCPSGTMASLPIRLWGRSALSVPGLDRPPLSRSFLFAGLRVEKRSGSRIQWLSFLPIVFLVLFFFFFFSSSRRRCMPCYPAAHVPLACVVAFLSFPSHMTFDASLADIALRLFYAHADPEAVFPLRSFIWPFSFSLERRWDKQPCRPSFPSSFFPFFPPSCPLSRWSARMRGVRNFFVDLFFSERRVGIRSPFFFPSFPPPLESRGIYFWLDS